MQIGTIDRLKAAEETGSAPAPQAIERFELHSLTGNVVVREWDIENDVLHWNVWLQKTFGHARPTDGDSTIEWWLERVHPVDLPAVRADLDMVLAGQATSWSALYRFRRADDSYAHILDRCYILRDGDGRAVRVIGSMLDVTKDRNTEIATDELNRELELRVADRTRELAVAVRELESFAYSVSHDLRTPLRALDGFSQALLEDYGSQLDETGQGYLRRIRAGSQRMSVLIDDMLRLSRVSRAAMRMEPIDLAEIARDVIAELTTGDAGRGVTFIVADTAPAMGDPRLLRIAVFNLLENACKFTRHTDSPCVEFGVKERDGRVTYFVADNGAGFDMAHADKLFGAFQRLHRADEFEGTGIGLATVHRIVRRHGGGIVADAARDRGATFYFTLNGGDLT